MEKIYFEVQGIGRVHLVQECGANLIVEDESGTRLSLPASRCTVSDQTAAALADQFTEKPPHLRGPIVQAYADTNGIPPEAADQFTGEDMGAQMAASEGFNHSVQVAEVGQLVGTRIGDGVVMWVVTTPDGFVYGVQRKECPDCHAMVLMGDEFDVIAAGYRVGDAHENGEG